MTERAVTERIIIVTGAARGLGREMTLALAAANARVVAVDLAGSGDELNSLRRSAEARGIAADRILATPGDVTSAADCSAAVDTAIRHFGAVHGLVNNAAVGMQDIGSVLGARKKFFEVPIDKWRAVIDVNVNGPFTMTRAVVPALIRQGFGRIVNLVTSYPTMQAAGFSPYGPTKAALEAATVIWARDLDGTGVTVNALLPGGAANTRMIPESDGVDRATLLQPAIMGPPIVWLMTKADASINGRRFIAADWDRSLAPDEAARKAGAPAGWYHDTPVAEPVRR